MAERYTTSGNSLRSVTSSSWQGRSDATVDGNLALEEQVDPVVAAFNDDKRIWGGQPLDKHSDAALGLFRTDAQSPPQQLPEDGATSYEATPAQQAHSSLRERASYALFAICAAYVGAEAVHHLVNR